MIKRSITFCKLFLPVILLFISSPSYSKDSDRYAVLKLQGSVNPIVSEYITGHIVKAADEGASFIVLQLSFGPIGWLMISEVFLLKLQDCGLSVVVLVNF